MFGVDADDDRVNDAIFVIGDGIDDGDDEYERDNGGNGCDVGVDRESDGTVVSMDGIDDGDVC